MSSAACLSGPSPSARFHVAGVTNSSGRRRHCTVANRSERHPEAERARNALAGHRRDALDDHRRTVLARRRKQTALQPIAVDPGEGAVADPRQVEQRAEGAVSVEDAHSTGSSRIDSDDDAHAEHLTIWRLFCACCFGVAQRQLAAS